MQLLLRDVFRDTIIKAKRLGLWEKLNASQKEALLSKYLEQHFKKGLDPERR